MKAAAALPPLSDTAPFKGQPERNALNVNAGGGGGQGLAPFPSPPSGQDPGCLAKHSRAVTGEKRKSPSFSTGESFAGAPPAHFPPPLFPPPQPLAEGRDASATVAGRTTSGPGRRGVTAEAFSGGGGVLRGGEKGHLKQSSPRPPRAWACHVFTSAWQKETLPHPHPHPGPISPVIREAPVRNGGGGLRGAGPQVHSHARQSPVSPLAPFNGPDNRPLACEPFLRACLHTAGAFLSEAPSPPPHP